MSTEARLDIHLEPNFKHFTLYLEKASMSLPATQLPTSVPYTALVNWIMLPILAHLKQVHQSIILLMSHLNCVHKNHWRLQQELKKCKYPFVRSKLV